MKHDEEAIMIDDTRIAFTPRQIEVIEALILRQVAAYNQRLFKRRLVDFELNNTENQSKAIQEAYAEAYADPDAKNGEKA